MTDPITREQVERLLADTLAGGNAFSSFYRSPQRELAPAYVLGAWEEDGGLRDVMEPALARWRDELAAAEPVRRVARWDARAINKECPFALEPPLRKQNGQVDAFWASRAQAIAWGYEIEGGPEPVDDTAPERLRERRDALGPSPADAAVLIVDPWTASDVEHCERVDCTPESVARYADALSAEEARRAAVGAWAASGGVLHYSPPTEPERPAPRFKVGDWVRVNDLGAAHHGHTYQIAEIYGSWHRKVRGDLDCSYMARNLEPASPPAPEVVDVPQPAPLPKTVAHFYTIRALPEPHRVSWNMPGDGPQWVRVNDSLWLHVDDLRAMLADIDAQQGGAS